MVMDIGNIDKWYESFGNFLQWAKLERGQLYGALIYLMETYNLQDIEIHHDLMVNAKDKKWIQFFVSEDGEVLTLHLAIIEEEKEKSE
jgi:hypothetical protein